MVGVGDFPFGITVKRLGGFIYAKAIGMIADLDLGGGECLVHEDSMLLGGIKVL